MKLGPYEIQTAERSSESRFAVSALRWSLVVIFVWFGAMKFTAYEAMAIEPLVAHDPITSWLLSVAGVRGASTLIGTIELVTAGALAAGAAIPALSLLGGAMSAATFLITLTFFVTTPGVGEATAAGSRRFPSCPVSSS